MLLSVGSWEKWWRRNFGAGGRSEGVELTATKLWHIHSHVLTRPPGNWNIANADDSTGSCVCLLAICRIQMGLLFRAQHCHLDRVTKGYRLISAPASSGSRRLLRSDNRRIVLHEV